uniref:N-(5'-phosphoribosyl)anthranilate isomerase n=1 Tax=Cyanothece sp. (strain PCC 7425 / ATCC 29141) TaxID=395961 RepID=B8HVU9_CYAP4
MRLRVKICGITQVEQGQAIAGLGVTSLGFICVPSSPRYISGIDIKQIVGQLPAGVDRIGVFANATLSEIEQTVAISGLTGVQLHGEESPEFSAQVRQRLPQVELIKALRIKSAADLERTGDYETSVDTFLLDAYDPAQRGGTGKTLNWDMLEDFQPRRSWFLAGGLTPDNVLQALQRVKPNGIDLSSGVERAPGDKDLNRVQALLANLQSLALCIKPSV